MAHDSDRFRFLGEIELSKIIDINDTDYMIDFEKAGMNIVKFKINGNEQTFMWEPYTKDIFRWLNPGRNKIELTIVNNLRNLLTRIIVKKVSCME